MDKGNHFYKCDLQMHTPRDRGWKKGTAISDEDREKYAKEFVTECRTAGLNAIAITDHHDMAFYTFIKNAAENELDGEGNPIPNEDKLIVFPGVELTLHMPPIQVLLILDSDFPQNLFTTLLGALSIAPAPKEDSKTIETQPIPRAAIDSINDIHDKLDANDAIKGRYIVLPHVKDGGHKTIMRKGFHEEYAKMKCSGGYVDGLRTQGDAGYEKILKGKVDAWGFKKITVVQTSDYRGDYNLKDNQISTWIKWKRPTAEALRQAFLAEESRISLITPEIPNIFIEKIDVTNSAFLSKFELDFNPQLNSLIGGRGTGKSTILEYLRWGLCDQTESFGGDSFKSEIERKRSNLIDKTLKAFDGEVRIFFMVNGTRHIIKRNPKSEDVLLKIGDGDFENVRPQQIKELLPIQAYSQKQLSSLSVKPDELKRFIEQPIAKDIEEIDIQINSAKNNVQYAYTNLSKSKGIQTELRKNDLEINSFKQQIEKLKSSLKGISEENKKTIDRAKYFVNEKNEIDEIKIEYDTIKESIKSLLEKIDRFNKKENDESIVFENIEIISKIQDERTKILKELKSGIDKIEELHEASYKKIDEYHKEWLEIRNKFEEEYKKAKETSSSSQTTLKAIKELEAKIEKLDLIIRQKKNELTNINATEEGFKEVFDSFIALQAAKSKKLKESTELFSSLSNDLIKADFSKTVDEELLGKQINTLFSSYSLNIPKAKGEKLAEIIATDENPLNKWKSLILEIKSLSEFNLSPEAQEELPATQILNVAGFTLPNKRKISDNLSNTGLIEFSTISPEFLPQFFYKTHNQMEDEIPFEDASAGQQATALLNVLLNQDGFPLIIDQPEDDIDNRAIEQIIQNLYKSKKKRQIIITSHNANLVVNGDSELVVCCDYNATSEQTRGHIKYQGSIDEQTVKDEITSIMEGGEKAFKLRKEKYGF